MLVQESAVDFDKKQTLRGVGKHHDLELNASKRTKQEQEDAAPAVSRKQLPGAEGESQSSPLGGFGGEKLEERSEETMNQNWDQNWDQSANQASGPSSRAGGYRGADRSTT